VSSRANNPIGFSRFTDLEDAEDLNDISNIVTHLESNIEDTCLQIAIDSINTTGAGKLAQKQNTIKANTCKDNFFELF